MSFIQAVTVYFYLTLLYVATAYFNKQFDPKGVESCFCQVCCSIIMKIPLHALNTQYKQYRIVTPF